MIWTILKYLFFYWVLVFSLFFIFQRSLIYFPDKHQVHLNRFDQRHIEMRYWKNPSGIRLFGFYHAPEKRKPTIVFFHGNAGNIASRKALMHLLIEKGYGVFMPEYRGYGGLIGHPSESGLYEDAISAIHYLQEKGIKEQDMIFFGESLGCAIALEMAANFKPRGLILQAPFLSLRSMAKLHYPYLHLPLLDKYNNEQKMGAITVPILILHGSADKIVPYYHGRRLYELATASQYRQFETFEHATHDLPWNDNFIQLIDEFTNVSATHSNADRQHASEDRTG